MTDFSGEFDAKTNKWTISVKRPLSAGDEFDNSISCGSHNTYEWFGQSDYVYKTNEQYNFNKFC